MPPANLQRAAPKLSTAQGHLDMSLREQRRHSGVADVPRRAGALLPYTYDVALVGTDAAGQPMSCGCTSHPRVRPVPVGASTYNGKIACFGQDDTYSYFQTGMTMTGTLRVGFRRGGGLGSAGHVDRQWFPLYAGGGGTGRRSARTRTRVAHDQPRQRRRPEHLAPVRPD